MARVSAICTIIMTLFFCGCFRAHLYTKISPKGDCQRAIEISAPEGESGPLKEITLRSDTAFEERFVISEEEIWEEKEELRGESYYREFTKDFPEPKGITDRIIERLFGDFVEIVRPETGEIKEGDEVVFDMDKGFLKVSYSYSETIRTVPKGIVIPEGSDIEISVVIPGKITSSNADAIDGKRAIWKPGNLNFPMTIEVKSVRTNLVNVIILGILGTVFIISLPFQFIRR